MSNHTDIQIIREARDYAAYRWVPIRCSDYTPEQRKLYDDTYYALYEKEWGVPDPRKKQETTNE